ncbi:RDD family protein [Microbacterium excoecariae]|uniref:RDD family protein n=1 Tax=Microbacterium excoecariae TaxID=2715210 RepID=UPI00140CF15C|nr:RDD family protein [Microbacterium excoecariae]NHI17451.1 RDD family protein [Microbacterium excoecariae]
MSPTAHPTGSTAAFAVHNDEVLTGEAVALDVQPLGLGLRVVGGLIDAVVGWGLVLLIVGWGLQSLAAGGVLDEATLQIATIVAYVVCFAGIPITVETLTRGRSLGRLAVGGRIVRADGGAVGFRHAFVRGLVGVLEIYLTFGGLALVVAAFTPRGQRLGDLVAGTHSERDRRPPLPAAPPEVPPALAAWARVADVARLPDRTDQRIARFAAGAHRMDPAVRARLAAELVREAAPFVSPQPAAPDEAALAAIAAVRRARERQALLSENARAEALARRGA